MRIREGSGPGFTNYFLCPPFALLLLPLEHDRPSVFNSKIYSPLLSRLCWTRCSSFQRMCFQNMPASLLLPVWWCLLVGGAFLLRQEEREEDGFGRACQAQRHHTNDVPAKYRLGICCYGLYVFLRCSIVVPLCIKTHRKKG